MYFSLYRSSNFSPTKNRKGSKTFSYVIPLSVLKSDIQTPAKLFYGFLKRMTRLRNGCVWTNEQISERFRVSVRTVTRWLSDLRSAGLITTDLTTTPTGGFIRNIQIVQEKCSVQYISIPESVALSPLLTDGEKLTYGVVVQLTKKIGECWASNSYIGGLLNASPESVMVWIRKLERVDLISVDRGLNDRKIWANDLQKFLSRNTTPISPAPPRQKRLKGDVIKSPPPHDAHIYILKNKKNNSACARESNSVVFSNEECNENDQTTHLPTKIPKPPREILPCLQKLPKEYRITDAAKRWICYRFSPQCIEKGVKYLLLRDPEYIKNALAYLTSAILGNYTHSNALVRKIEMLTTLITAGAPKSIAEKMSRLPRGVILAYSPKFGWEQRSKTAITNQEADEYISTLCKLCGGSLVVDGLEIRVLGPNGGLVARM